MILHKNVAVAPDADRIMGMSYYNLEDYGKAVDFLQKAIKKNDKDAEADYTFGPYLPRTWKMKKMQFHNFKRL